ncbi:hypothetical protein C8J56DRAFT_1040678 [Mycena floridula]|nr:hypothetical protein C8J56DRAFT_1040678 [Mycena floridula]
MPDKEKKAGRAKAKRPQQSHLLGAHNGGGKTYDSEKRYLPDEPGMDMSYDTRVWLVCLDESEEYDREMIEGWLFSAVMTTFVTSQASQPDWTMITASLMAEMVSLQRSIANATATDVLHSVLGMNISSSDVWLDVLWFASLSFVSAGISIFVASTTQIFIDLAFYLI